MNDRDAFARRVFLFAGVYGLATLLPQYFMEEILARDFPPALTHPEQFYGFIGVAAAWQIAFFLISYDVQRFRLFMVPAILEKLSFGIAALVLYGQGRAVLFVAWAGSVDLLFAGFFLVAFCRSSKKLALRQS